MLRVLSIVFAAVPFAFALIRAFQTGDDFRFLWMAIASFLGATVVMALGKRIRKPGAVLGLLTGALIVATLVGGLTAFALGARAPLAIWMVAVGFGLCCTASYALNALSRVR